MSKPKIIAVDGPAGTGKSSVCSKVSETLGWTYVNTGFLYRAIAVLAKMQGIDTSDEVGCAKIAATFEDQLSWDPDQSTVRYENMDITAKLQTPEASAGASQVAKMPSVRRNLLAVQRRLPLSSSKGALIEGRDIGTVIFPDADLKIFMTASLEKRARRRLEQMGASVSSNYGDLEAMMAEIDRRDNQDASRGCAPLKKADDAIYLDTSYIDFDEAVDKMLVLIKERLGAD